MATLFDKQTRLNDLVQRAELSYAVAQQRARQQGKTAAVRHKCFVSHHSADIDEVITFVEDFNEVFIPRVVGVSDSDHFKDPVDSTDEDYIRSEIGRKYLTDSTVTIVFVGRCAWARKFIDWEIASTLRNSPNNRRSGLLAITPQDRAVHQQPARLTDNLDKGTAADCYARSYYYPGNESNLRAFIEDAFQARTSRAHLVKNSRSLRTYNATC